MSSSKSAKTLQHSPKTIRYGLLKAVVGLPECNNTFYYLPSLTIGLQCTGFNFSDRMASVDQIMIMSCLGRTHKRYIPFDEVSKEIDEKFQTTVLAGIPTLGQLSMMSKGQAVALVGNRRRVPFTFVVAPVARNYPHAFARNT